MRSWWGGSVSIRKLLLAALAPHLPVLGTIFGAIIGVTLMGVSAYFDNATMFLLSIVITAVLPPVLEAVGNSLKEKYEATQNEVDIIAMIPEWSIGLEMLSSIAIIIASAVLKDVAIFNLGALLSVLGYSLAIAKEINGLKEDLRSPDLERRRTAMEKVELDEKNVAVAASLLFFVFFVNFLTILYDEVVLGSAVSLAEVITTVALLLASPLLYGIVYVQAKKVMPPEPEKAARAAS
jgi:ACR3 family arsenite efflux pump ArsB